MSKYYGAIGYSISVETRPGVYSPSIVDRMYTGDILQNQRRWENGESANDDLNISNRISIVADDFAYENVGNMLYMQFLGTRWKVKTVEVNRPRLIISLGGVYNGPLPR